MLPARFRIFFCLAAMGVLSSAPAQSISSQPSGAVSVTIKGRSDSVLAVPLARRPVYFGKVSSIASGAGGFLLAVAGTPGWSPNRFAAGHYVRFTSGVRAGMYYTITANTGSRLTLDPVGDNLANVAANDTFQVFPHWTLGSLFPPTTAGTALNPLTPSASVAPGDRRSQVLLPDNVNAGINLPPGGGFFFTAAGWVADLPGYPRANDTILPPDSFFIVRQPAAVSADVTWLATGGVVATAVTIPLATQATGKQDNYVGLIRPVDVKLIESGLNSGFVDSFGKAGFQRRDTLLVFDNAVAGFNKSAAKSYFRFAGTWYSDARGNPIANDDVLPAGSGFVIRKYNRAGGATAWWSNLPPY